MKYLFLTKVSSMASLFFVSGLAFAGAAPPVAVSEPGVFALFAASVAVLAVIRNGSRK